MPEGAPATSHEVFPLQGKRVYVAGHRGMVGGALVRAGSTGRRSNKAEIP